MSEIEKRCAECGSLVTRAHGPASRLPVSSVRGLRVDEIHVVEWHNKPEPVGRADCVALLLKLEGADDPLVIRLKSAAYCDELIRTLQTHRAGVWPQAR